MQIGKERRLQQKAMRKRTNTWIRLVSGDIREGNRHWEEENPQHWEAETSGIEKSPCNFRTHRLEEKKMVGNENVRRMRGYFELSIEKAFHRFALGALAWKKRPGVEIMEGMRGILEIARDRGKRKGIFWGNTKAGNESCSFKALSLAVIIRSCPRSSYWRSFHAKRVGCNG